MNMIFSEVDKKVLLILIVTTVVVLFVGFLAYYVADAAFLGLDSTGGGALNVCLNRCGDGICQELDSNCGRNNCICQETYQYCPRDCK